MSEPKQPRPAASYATLYPRLCEVARPLGYALALHGSMVRDMDVVAVPWVEDAATPEALVEALVGAVGGLLLSDLDGLDGNPYAAGPGEAKPHGRRAWQIHFRTGGTDCIDLSVLPRCPDSA